MENVKIEPSGDCLRQPALPPIGLPFLSSHFRLELRSFGDADGRAR